MRSFLLILATLLIIGGGFAVYFWMQPRVVVPEQTTQVGSATRPHRPEGSGSVIGSGTESWVKRWNTKTGELASQFRAARYDPQRDGTILVEKPQAEFVLDEGRLLRVEGRSGSVIIPQAPPSDDEDPLSGGMSMQAPPSRGMLRDVKLELFESMADADANAEPYLTVTMNNAAFDNDTFRITTESYVDAQGTEVPGDEVPVVVRGKDYDFDGRGLTIRWNDLSQRLELLEIAHGERLVVKNPELMDQFGQSSKAQRDRADAPATAPSTQPPPAPAASSKKKKKKPKPASPAPATQREAQETLYQATFERDVQITQNDEPLVLADTLRAQFLLGEGEVDADAAEEPVEAPATTSGPAVNEVSTSNEPGSVQGLEPVNAKAGDAGAATRSATTTATSETESPATQGAQTTAPIVVRWNGRLTIAPIEQSESTDLQVGQGLVHLTGFPLSLKWEGSTITCGSAVYTTGGEIARFDATDDVPVVTMTDKRGSVVTTRQMTYSNADGTARLSGVSLARIPTSEEESAELLQLAWDRTCVLRFVEDEAGDRVIDRADIEGNVAVDHPRMKLTSDALHLAFAPSAASDEENSIELDRLIATGSAHCDIKDEARGDQTFSADRLELATAKDPAGKVYPRQIDANGNVIATDDTSRMTAGHVTVMLRPASPPSPDTTGAGQDAASTRSPTTTADDGGEGSAPSSGTPGEGRGEGLSNDELKDIALESLTARENVRLTTDDGAEMTADQLLVNVENEKTIVQLLGKGDVPATLSDGESTLRGQQIVTTLEDQKADVLGAGSIHGVAVREGSDAEPQPFDLSWSGGATLDGNANRVTFRERILLTMTQPNGPATTARADRAEITLADKVESSTQPATGPVASAGDAVSEPATAPRTQPKQDSIFAGGSAFGEMLEKKEPIALSLNGNVKVESAETGEDGAVVRGVLIRGDTLNYDLLKRIALIPGAGQMLVQDHRPMDPAEERLGSSDFQDRGSTAFEWRERLAYSDADRIATMEGDVVIHHVPDPGTKGREFWMWTQRIEAELESKATDADALAATQPTPATSPATSPTTLASTQPAPDAFESVALKRLIAEGDVRVEADHRAAPDAPPEKMQLNARAIEYDAATGILTASGTEDRPVRIGGSATIREGAVQELRWNTRTDQIEVTKGRVR